MIKQNWQKNIIISLLFSSFIYYLWKLGVISFWKRFILKRYRLKKEDIPVGGVMPRNANVQKVSEKEINQNWNGKVLGK